MPIPPLLLVCTALLSNPITPALSKTPKTLTMTENILPPALCQKIVAEVKANFETEIRDPWFPLAVDKTGGGFSQEFSATWQPVHTSNGEKSIVYQSRLTYVAAQVARRDPAKATEYTDYVRHGIDYLRGTMWDGESGGFYWAVSASGKPETSRGTEKHAYGVSFGIYAAAEAYHTTKDAKALTLAKDAFLWLDRHAHDPKNNGYYEALRRDGTPLMQPPAPGVTGDPIGTHYGYKSMNTHIHLLEAFSSLYQVWPDAQVKKRLEEVFHLVRDRITVEPGCMNLYFTPDWRAIPDHDSFGHDIETAFLLQEAAETLGLKHDARTEKVSRSLVDHALAYGWDEKNGGFFEGGSAFGSPSDTSKVWWTQAEGLNALLQMHVRYRAETSVYGAAFLKSWTFIRDKQTDAAHTGWITRMMATGEPDGADQNKSDAWKDPYHQGRATLHVIELLDELAK